jgi:uncharacterized protein YaaR (DUF327 family)
MGKSRRLNNLLLSFLTVALSSLLIACGGISSKPTKPDADKQRDTNKEIQKAEKPSVKAADPKTEIPKAERPSVKASAPDDDSEIVSNGMPRDAAYDDVLEPRKTRLVTTWKTELEALKNAIQADEERLKNARTTKDKQHFIALIKEYKEKLARHEKNDPPYDPEGEASRRSKAAKKKQEEDEQNVSGLVLIKSSLQGVSNEFSGEITGTIINRRKEKVAYTQITFNVYDQSGARVGTALANITDLEPGGRWNFKAVTFSRFKTYKFAELVGR